MSDMSAVVVGLGYVGMTLAVALARRGVVVTGIETRSEVVEMANRGTPHFAEVGLAEALREAIVAKRFIAHALYDDVPPADYYVITVGTPLVAGSTQPRLDMIERAASEVARNMKDGSTIILRSTVKVGTTRQVVMPILEASGKRFHLAMCPERTLEGDALRELLTLPQIVGGVDDDASDRATQLFSRLTNTLVRVSSPETAEMIKLVDNTSRDVRFAFANEVARACDAGGIDAHEVINSGKLGYARTNVALPGLVGGPCLEKDPHILLSSFAGFGIDLEITRASRLVNERQPTETVGQMLALMDARGKRGLLTIALIGLAFKGVPATDDLRGSMSLKVLEAIHASGRAATIRGYDPVVEPSALTEAIPEIVVCASIEEACHGADLLVIGNNHPTFRALDLEDIRSKMQPGAAIYDYWANLADYPPDKLKGIYYAVGNIRGVA